MEVQIFPNYVAATEGTPLVAHHRHGCVLFHSQEQEDFTDHMQGQSVENVLVEESNHDVRDFAKQLVVAVELDVGALAQVLDSTQEITLAELDTVIAVDILE